MEWHMERLGKPTASQFDKIKPGRGKTWSDATITYMKELLAERLTGQWVEAYGNAIEWGNDHEDEARELYTVRTGNQVAQVGFIKSLDGLTGGSPDGMVSESEGMIEIKCPYVSKNHIEYILNGCDDHWPQIQGNMYFTGAKWADFISYDPRMPEELQLFVIRVERDDNYIVEMIARVQAFLIELDAMERQIRNIITSKP
jgi:hypothetical protein